MINWAEMAQGAECVGISFSAVLKNVFNMLKNVLKMSLFLLLCRWWHLKDASTRHLLCTDYWWYSRHSYQIFKVIKSFNIQPCYML